MKKILFLITIIFLKFNAIEQKPNQYYLSFITYFEPGQEIFIKNDTHKKIKIFDNIYYIYDNGKELYPFGIELAPMSERVIELCRIASYKEITTLKICDFKELLTIDLEVGAKYLISIENDELIVTKG